MLRTCDECGYTTETKITYCPNSVQGADCMGTLRSNLHLETMTECAKIAATATALGMDPCDAILRARDKVAS